MIVEDLGSTQQSQTDFEENGFPFLFVRRASMNCRLMMSKDQDVDNVPFVDTTPHLIAPAALEPFLHIECENLSWFASNSSHFRSNVSSTEEGLHKCMYAVVPLVLFLSSCLMIFSRWRKNIDASCCVVVENMKWSRPMRALKATGRIPI